MPGRFVRRTILVSLAYWTLAVQARETPAPVVRSAAQLESVLASSQPSPLDAFTPYGKRRFLQSLRWNERGVSSFSTALLERELEPRQIADVLAFIDASAYLPMVVNDLAGAPLRLPAPSADAEARLAQILRFTEEEHRDDTAGAVTMTDDTRLERRFVAVFGQRPSRFTLQGLPVGDLPLYFDAAARAAQGGMDSVATRFLMAVYEEMQGRGIDTRRSFDAIVLKRMLEAREFGQARAFAADKLHLAGRAIPTVRDRLGPRFEGRSAYRYDAASNTLVREAVPLPRGTELVMVVDAGCHFSADALAALRDDAAMRARLLKAGLVLITPPRAAFPAGFIGAWNTSNPTLPIRVPYSVGEWQAVDVPNVPRFFLLKDGKVVKQLSGWPAEGHKAALLALLDGAAD
ncbi:hypothetical protein [Massilia agri]|uniref:Thioredoxin domain-containing protein n=1 Tax=Massilia agri TaxID=1886785 RepID=A0ABT2ANZ1_9BURK|nr:hypothetical protein [Massilia agri]MCS0597468.1 hypothetical protein [Massilia agri]